MTGYICEDCGELATPVKSCVCVAEDVTDEYIKMLELTKN